MGNKEHAKQFLDMATLLQYKGFFDIFVLYSQPEYRILDLLLRNEEDLSPSTLSDILRISRVNITNALNNLESECKITRSIDAQDRRKVIVRLTDVGSKEILEVQDKIINFLAELFETIGEDNRDKLTEVINIITSKISN